MLKRSLFIAAAIFAILVASTATLMSGKQLATTINWLLPTGWQIETPESLETSWHGTRLPSFHLSYQGCPLLTAENLAIQWSNQHLLALDNATLDYHCLEQLPKNQTSGEPLSLNTLLAFVPTGEIKVQALHWQNLPKTLPPRLTELLASPSQWHFAFSGKDLTASLQQAVVSAEAKLTDLDLQGKIRYQPQGKEQEQHQLDFSGKLNDDLTALPTQFQASYQWKLPKTIITETALQQGKANLEWSQNSEQALQGTLTMQSLAEPQNQASLPFQFKQQTLQIEKGQFYWDWLPDFPLKGFVSAQLTAKDFVEFFPLKSYIRLSLQSQGLRGKGTLVLENKNGEWQKNATNLPLQITGEVKYGDLVLFSSVPMQLSGDYTDLDLKFLPSSLVRLIGKEKYLTINDLRFPLAGIRVDKYGITGRLQALFKGESPDFKPINLHLDGFANHFKAGALSFFETHKTANSVQDRWQWRIWGNSTIKMLNSTLNLSGRGIWQKQNIQLTELNGELGKIKQSGVMLPKVTLKMTENLQFAYTKNQLTGAVQIASPSLNLDYGGNLPNPTLNLTLRGALENLNLKGIFNAKELGPLTLFARRELTQHASRFVGKLYWQEQPADVFQPLFPFRQQMIITGGTIRGETAFSSDAKNGFIAGGHFAIRSGSLSLPSGNVEGIDFSLPYKLQKNRFEFGVKQPIDVYIREVNLGFPIHNVEMKINGHYPYTAKKPLKLKQLSMELLGGLLTIEQLALPQQQQALLKLEEISFEEILKLLKYQQIDLKGKANATLPFWLSGKPCYICDGLLTQAGSSSLKFTPELLEAMKSSGYTEKLLLYLMNNTQIDELRSLINVATDGSMVLDAKLKMHLLEQQQASINFNYNHKENLFDLWKLINYGSQFEQDIEHSIYQKLDKQ